MIWKTRKEVCISINQIPFFHDQRPEAKKKRQKLIVFVNVTRKKWTASKHTVICSVHFAPKDFSHLSYYGQKYQWPLKRDEIGVISVPSMHSVKTPEEETNRDIRMKCHEVCLTFISLNLVWDTWYANSYLKLFDSMKRCSRHYILSFILYILRFSRQKSMK